MKTKCKHKTKHIEKVQGHICTVYGDIINGQYFSYETPARNSIIITWCADCGKKLKSVELSDYK